MESLLEFVGTVHIFLGPYRGNPIGLYLQRDGEVCRISPRIYPWNQTIGVGESPNKAAADFEQKWKETTGLAPEMYTGPHWEGGIKPEKPKPAAPPKPAPASAAKPPSAPAESKAPSSSEASLANDPVLSPSSNSEKAS
ncbi:MAG: hypothetical protein D6690_12995 [Nitrospirae bacterium]|nr:MAG: hypothetical protein D6690_12995 [Nitrospirota bacterium]